MSDTKTETGTERTYNPFAPDNQSDEAALR
jgi:hypothetical protein